MRTLIVTTALLLASCSTKQLKVEDRLMTEDFNEYSFKKPCAIYFKDSTASQNGKEFRIEKDVAYWTNVKTGQEDSAAVSKIKKVSFTIHRKGAAIGAGVGAAAGALLGVMLFAAARDADKEPTSGEGMQIAATPIAVAAFPILLLGGAGVGAVAGLIKGYETIYKFE